MKVMGLMVVMGDVGVGDYGVVMGSDGLGMRGGDRCVERSCVVLRVTGMLNGAAE